MWSTCLRREQTTALDVSGLEPAFEDRLVHRNVLGEPIVADVVETPFDIGFKDPLRRAFPSQHRVALPDGVCHTSAGAEPVRVLIPGRLRDGFESQQV